MEIRNFKDFCTALLDCGFSMGGGNAKGTFALIPYGWEEQDAIDSPVKWHTGDPETDPWEWRMRVLEEREDIAYAKLFFRASGYITREWYPRFLAVRRRGMVFEEAYSAGTVGECARRIYELVAGSAAAGAGALPVHEIKRLGGFLREENVRFERALTELQTRMFLTMSGRERKKNRFGEGYGWNSTAFTTAEAFWAERGVPLPDLDPQESYTLIRQQLLRLNPGTPEKKLERFIRG